MSEESLVVCDANNNVRGAQPKSEVHQKELWHQGAHLWVTDGAGNLLQQHRDASKKILPDVWDIPVAGHVSAGDTPEETVVREAEEELGLVLKLNDFSPVSITITDMPIPAWGGRRHRVFDHNFCMKLLIPDLSQLSLEEGAVDGIRWYPIDQLETDLRKGGAAAQQHAFRGPEEQNSRLYATAIAAMRRLCK
jgi:isopentenyldiphosphate isomerase